MRLNHIVRTVLKSKIDKNLSLLCKSFLSLTMQFAKKLRDKKRNFILFLIIGSLVPRTDQVQNPVILLASNLLVSNCIEICNIIIMVEIQFLFFFNKWEMKNARGWK